ncbi:prepilin-type N-terminal cleavage/methylation domain-containing protein [Rossellomorea vietnamensis]|uniref:type IV pilus modification PilV family protein n=1 Tax=Rossellomorea vietnamensis TaxID=218284 RepID=UPI001CCF26B7|nr:prepilin-type N-terminal cleavage/methylation domain-containing protein [Rossellomorea vietnamensis]MCA0150485.1 prepilin-type N-terminal cleavage/methylation domain-containing protein [Rossellomorea vietnamensis]
MVHNEKGITLLEVLVSITILSVILLSITNFFPQMGMMNEHNGAKSQGVNEAKEILVKWKASREVRKFLIDPAPINRPVEYKSEDNTYFYFNTSEQNFDIHIKIKKKSDLNSTPSKAHFIEIKLQKDHHIVSETYGYISIDD